MINEETLFSELENAIYHSEENDKEVHDLWDSHDDYTSEEVNDLLGNINFYDGLARGLQLGLGLSFGQEYMAKIAKQHRQDAHEHFFGHRK